ncbi:MAG: LysM peptidoglycan-binding domain-containing protein [Verrucomicrobiota bacterium]
MKLDQIPTRRKPVQKTVYARLFNRTKFRKQRASAATASPEEFDDSGSNISRSLSIIFAIHILAIGMIFIHKQYLSGRTDAPAVANQEEADHSVAAAVSPERMDQLPELSTGVKPYMVKKGDNFTIIAAKYGVDEAELRKLNQGKELRAGAVFRIPQAKRIVAVEPVEVEAIRNQSTPNSSEDGLVEIPLNANGSQAVANLPNAIPRAVPTVATGKTHTVKSGESVWRISKQYNLTEKDLMSLNGISDPSKLRTGQVLKLP